MAEITKVGIISCSGEEIPGGTISRLATRRVLELLRPQSTVTLCLPLFLAGEEQERRFAREHPTITVDGCDKLCAKRATEQYSGRVAASIVVPEILGDRVTKCHRSLRDVDKADEETVWLVAERIAAEVDAVSAAAPEAQAAEAVQAVSCGCSCGSTTREENVKVGGRTVTITGLSLIFDHLYKQRLAPGDDSASRLLESVRIYHAIEPGEEAAYCDALVAAYQKYCQGRPKVDARGKQLST